MMKNQCEGFPMGKSLPLLRSVSHGSLWDRLAITRQYSVYSCKMYVLSANNLLVSTGEMAQSVMCLSCKHENLSSDLSTHMLNQAWHRSATPTLQWWRTETISRDNWSAYLHRSAPSSERDPASKTRREWLKKTLTSDHNTHVYTCAYTPACM